MDGIQGDKVVWMIVLLLFMISILAIFSSTPLLSLETRVERLEIMKSHGLIAAFGLMLIIALYKMKKIGLYRFFAQFGFFGFIHAAVHSGPPHQLRVHQGTGT